MSTERRYRPPVVSPYASTSEVYEFLANFLLALNDRLSLEEAREDAHKMFEVDGKALYNKSEKEFKDGFGEAGVQIYRELYGSGYGYVYKPSSLTPFLFNFFY